MTDEIRVVLPEYATDDVSENLRLLTQQLAARGTEISGGFLGGEFGYGGYHDDATFMMHPYCWCEKDDCPWCGGCQVERGEPEHKPDCYLWCVHRDLIALGFTQAAWASGPYAEPPKGWNYDRYHAAKNRVQQKWCEHFGLTFPYGCAVHCTCGASAKYEAECSACTCDACTAKGQWGANGAIPKKSAPNFWHKPSGLRVWWYKYIGRDMEIECPDGVNAPRVVASCFPVSES